ncbi:MAG: tetratricopeptide repeat protein [Bryobacteraceae bacterium]|nr:tetratricopeptide repeat protein [Bryobacteraceae bacterium]
MSRTPQKLSGSRAYREAWRAVNLLIRSDGSWSGRERDVCYRNLGDGRFEDVSFVSGMDSAGDGRAFAVLDLDGDGSPDLALTSRTAPRLRLLRNQPGAALVVELRGAGGNSNPDAIGAVAEMESDRGRKLVRIVQAGAGFLSQSSRRLHFAFEPGERPRMLTITWPGGNRQVLRAVPTRGTVRLREGTETFERFTTPVHKREKQEAQPGPVWLVEPVAAPELAGLRPGKPTLLNFWASWCPPCRQEMAEWRAAAVRFRAAGLDVVIASVDEDLTKRPDAPFTLLHPTQRQVAAWNLFHRHLFDRRQDIGLPMSFLLDEQGRVRKVYKGVTASAAILADLRASRHPSLPFAGKWHGPQPRRNYVELATALAEHGLGPESERYFEVAVSAEKPPLEALNNYAGVLLESGNLARAEELLLRTLTEYPRQVDALTNLAALRLKQGQMTAAREVFRQVLAVQPDDPFAHNGLGSALFAAKDLAAAVAAFQEAVRLDPDNPDYRYSLGSALAASGSFGAALREFETVRAARPESAELLGNLGILYVETGDATRGEAAFRRAIELAPEQAGGYLNLAMLYTRTGKKAEARRVLQQFLDAHPGHPQAAQMLESLR